MVNGKSVQEKNIYYVKNFFIPIGVIKILILLRQFFRKTFKNVVKNMNK